MIVKSDLIFSVGECPLEITCKSCDRVHVLACNPSSKLNNVQWVCPGCNAVWVSMVLVSVESTVENGPAFVDGVRQGDSPQITREKYGV